VRLRPLAVLAAFAVALAAAGHAAAFTKTDGSVVMDDGVKIATTLYLPDGTPPTAGRPGIVMLHGIGGSRRYMNLLAEAFFVNQGYAVLTYDVRGHGESGGGVVPTSAGTHTYSIRMISQVTAIPAGSKLVVTFGSSTSGTAGGLLYLDLPTTGSPKLTIGAASLRLPALVKPVSSP
jgi:predicted acyl esterase